MSYIARNITTVTTRLNSYVGESQECVSPVKALTGAPRTIFWKRGVQVKGATIETGTAIATFNKKGKYEGHAAIYIKQDEKGIYVYDQWSGRPLGERIILFKGKGYVSNDGDQFYVIE